MGAIRSEKGPPRKVYSLDGSGRERLAGFWESWDFLSAHIDALRPARAPIQDAADTNPHLTNGDHA